MKPCARNAAIACRPCPHGGKAAAAAPNHLKREFEEGEPNRVWVTDITYIRAHEGRLYLAFELDLFSRQVIDWSMSSRIGSELAPNALLMAVRRRLAESAQYTSRDWPDFLRENRLQPIMSRRGNCRDNAVAESFFQLLKHERNRRKTYRDCESARCDVFVYIEMSRTPNDGTATPPSSRPSSSNSNTSTRSKVSRESGRFTRKQRRRLHEGDPAS